MSDAELLRARRERDLYLGLLRLGERRSPEPFLKDALSLVVAASTAKKGYLELFDPKHHNESTLWRATGFSAEELERVRSLVSRGIIAEAVATGKVVVTASALLDPRFRDRDSVRRSKIESVLCSPIGSDSPLGVLYLAGEEGGTPFSPEDVACAERFSEHLAPIFQKLLHGRELEDDDPTSEIRQRLDVAELIGKSDAIASVLREVELIAPLDIGVLVTGDTGTGKTRLARAIHENSKRRGQPLGLLDCAADSPDAVERELFGSAGTGASLQGRLASADRGTLVLEQVDELSSSAQARLLRFLRSGEYSPLDGDRLIKADIRLIATTSVDLSEASHQGRFREELLYQLGVVTIRIPALAERRKDVVALAEYFCARASLRHKLPRVTLSPGAIRAIEASEWRGNVRELANSIEAAVLKATAERVERVEASHVFATGGGAPQDSVTFQEATRVFQSHLLSRTLEATSWNVAAAARKLDLTRAHVYNLIKAFGLRRTRLNDD